MADAKKQVTMISNSTAVQQVFGRICHRFDGLFSRRAFMKHYLLDRVEEMDLELTREDMKTLEDFYDEIKKEPKAIRQHRASYIPSDADESMRE